VWLVGVLSRVNDAGVKRRIRVSGETFIVARGTGGHIKPAKFQNADFTSSGKDRKLLYAERGRPVRANRMAFSF
jgi:hypothetical protein